MGSLLKLLLVEVLPILVTAAANTLKAAYDRRRNKDKKRDSCNGCDTPDRRKAPHGHLRG